MRKKFTGTFYFYLEHYTYAKSNGISVILLNTLDNQYDIYYDNKIVILVESLLAAPNGIIVVNFDIDYKDKIYEVFFNNILNKYMGDLINTEHSLSEPINYRPIAVINRNIRDNNEKQLIGSNRLDDYVFNFNIYLNNECRHNCSNCNNYYKQFLCCSKFVGEYGNNSIDISVIKNIFKYHTFHNILNINILGGDVSLYKEIDMLFEILVSYKDKCHAYFNYLNINSINSKIKYFFEDRIHIIIDLEQIDKVDFKVLIQKYNQYEICLIVQNYDQIRKLLESYDLDLKYKIMPFFNKTNTSFFESNVFLDENDILNGSTSIRAIHRNQLINSFFFGDLTISPDNEVYTNVNFKSIGSLKSESMDSFLKKCLLDNDSLWFKTRNKTSCNDCLISDLCSPISNYELVMDRYNLCKLDIIFIKK